MCLVALFTITLLSCDNASPQFNTKGTDDGKGDDNTGDILFVTRNKDNVNAKSIIGELKNDKTFAFEYEFAPIIVGYNKLSSIQSGFYDLIVVIDEGRNIQDVQDSNITKFKDTFKDKDRVIIYTLYKEGSIIPNAPLNIIYPTTPSSTKADTIEAVISTDATYCKMRDEKVANVIKLKV